MTNNLEIEKINAAVDLLIESDVDLSNALGKDGLIKQLSKRILERALEAEMDNHLGYSRYDRSNIQNARNGGFQKNLVTDNGVIELNVPRDRNGDFEPIIVKKKQSRIAGLDQKMGLSLQLCKFLHKSLNIFMNSIFKFNQKMSHSFSPILNWHSPFCSDIINCQV